MNLGTIYLWPALESSQKNIIQLLVIPTKAVNVHRGSYMSAHVLLNLLNKLGKSDKIQ